MLVSGEVSLPGLWASAMSPCAHMTSSLCTLSESERESSSELTGASSSKGIPLHRSPTLMISLQALLNFFFQVIFYLIYFYQASLQIQLAYYLVKLNHKALMWSRRNGAQKSSTVSYFLAFSLCNNSLEGAREELIFIENLLHARNCTRGLLHLQVIPEKYAILSPLQIRKLRCRKVK